jgi:hypothetical protein
MYYFPEAQQSRTPPFLSADFVAARSILNLPVRSRSTGLTQRPKQANLRCGRSLFGQEHAFVDEDETCMSALGGEASQR